MGLDVTVYKNVEYIKDRMTQDEWKGLLDSDGGLCRQSLRERILSPFCPTRNQVRSVPSLWGP